MKRLRVADLRTEYKAEELIRSTTTFGQHSRRPINV